MADILRYFVPDWPCCPKALRGKQDGDKPKTINIFLGFFFMVNFILGTGFLGIPYGFFHGGLIAGLCSLLVVALVAWVCALWEVETMARAQALCDHRNNEESFDNELETKENMNTKPNFYITIMRKFELSEMCELFVGRWLKIVYLLLLTAYIFLALLSYSAVTGSAWSVNIPLNFGTLEECTDQDFLHQILPHGRCLNAYRFCLFLFAVVVIPLSLLDLKEQAIVQLILGLLRFFTLGAIIIYCFFYVVQGYTITSCEDPLPISKNVYMNMNNTSHDITPIKDILIHFNFAGWVVSIPVFVYAFLLHNGIPALTHPIKEKNWLRCYFNVIFLTMTILYASLGVMVSLWFRDCTNETCTLNWHPLTSPVHSIAIRVLSYYIVLFPSIDVCSVYPLVVHTLVNNIYTVIFNRDTSQAKGWKHRFLQLLMKFIVAILPITVALVVSNLVHVLKYAGLIGFTAFFFPIFLQLSSQWVCCKTFSYMLDKPGGYSTKKKSRSITENKSDNSMEMQDMIEEEDALLLNEEDNNTSTMKRVFEFLFTRKNASLYMTPYSTVLSYPISVIIISILACICFILSIVSLFVHPT